MSIVITGDLSWTGDLVLFLEALDGGPAADTDGYTFTSSGDMEYSCSITDTILGLYRCVAKTSGGIIAGAGYVTVGASTTAARIRSEEAAELDPASVSAIRDGIPKVGETHRYTQVDSGATTTDVSIGEAT
mgnify:CR=1 FL=1